MKIENYIGTGKDNATLRQTLVQLTGLTDRQVRREIQSARERGVLIVNGGDGEGYYLTEDPADLSRQLRMNHSRAMSILVQNVHLRRKLEELGKAVSQDG